MDTSPHALLMHVQQSYFADRRSTFVDVALAEQGHALSLRGTVLDRNVAEAFVHVLREQAPQLDWQVDLTPLVDGPEYQWAVVNRPVVDLRREPHNQAEQISQAVWGETIEVLRTVGSWAYVRLADGYLGWLHREPLALCTAQTATAWREASTHVVAQAFLPCYTDPSVCPEQQVALLPFGSKLHVEQTKDSVVAIHWPDGQIRWTPADGIVPQAAWPTATCQGLQIVAQWTQRMISVPYVWGGRTPFGYDCSGLVQTMYSLVGIALRRDADQQFAMGTPVAVDELAFGDLVFFDTEIEAAALNTTSERNVSHVGFALGQTMFLHTSRRGGGVHRSALDDPASTLGTSYRARCLGARRYV